MLAMIVGIRSCSILLYLAYLYSFFIAPYLALGGGVWLSGVLWSLMFLYRPLQCSSDWYTNYAVIHGRIYILELMRNSHNAVSVLSNFTANRSHVEVFSQLRSIRLNPGLVLEFQPTLDFRVASCTSRKGALHRCSSFCATIGLSVGGSGANLHESLQTVGFWASLAIHTVRASQIRHAGTVQLQSAAQHHRTHRLRDRDLLSYTSLRTLPCRYCKFSTMLSRYGRDASSDTSSMRRGVGSTRKRSYPGTLPHPNVC
jgi:hypothetical protein